MILFCIDVVLRLFPGSVLLSSITKYYYLSRCPLPLSSMTTSHVVLSRYLLLLTLFLLVDILTC